MRVILLIIALNKIVNAQTSSTKYIDLLPEKEKEEFLDRIARRIFEEVQTRDDKVKPSGELTDDELNKHTDFVNQILKEESENLRKKGNDTGLVENAEPKAVALRQDKVNAMKNERYIDLTLRANSNRNKRENQRRVFSAFTTSKENDHDDGEQSDVQDIQVKNFRKKRDDSFETDNKNMNSSKTENIAQEIEESTKIDENIKEATTESNINKEDSATEYTKTTEEKLSTHSNVDVVEVDNKVFIKNNNTVHAQGLRTVDEKPKLNINHEISDDNIKNEKSTIFDQTKAPQNQATRSSRSNTNEDIETTKKRNANPKTDTKAETVSENESKIYNIEIKSATETPKVINTIPPRDETKLTSVTNYNKNTKETNPNLDNEKITLTTTTKSLKKVLRAGNRDSKTTRNKVPITTVNKLKGKVTENVSNKDENLIKNGKADAIRVKMYKTNINKENDVYDLRAEADKNQLNGYHVYEISPDTSPFVQTQENKDNKMIIKPEKKINDKAKNLQAPYKIPIYNYLPKNAYYNSRNVLGPNAVSENEKNNKMKGKNYIFERVMHSPDDSSKTKKHSKIHSDPKNLYKKQPEYVPVYNFSPKNAFFNPYNYFGLDNDPKISKSNDRHESYDDNYDISEYDDEMNDKRTKKFERDYYYTQSRLEDMNRESKTQGEPLNLPMVYPSQDSVKLQPNDNKETWRNSKNNLNCESAENVSDECGIAKGVESSKKATNPGVPPSSLNLDNIKDNLSAVRQILAANKYFKLSNPINTKEIDELKQEAQSIQDAKQNMVRTLIDLSKYNKDSKNTNKNADYLYNIAMDYYFGRTENKNGYFIKQLQNPNIKTIRVPFVYYIPKRNKKFKEETTNLGKKLIAENNQQLLENKIKTINKQAPVELENKLKKIIEEKSLYNTDNILTTTNKSDYMLIKDIINAIPDNDLTTVSQKLDKIDTEMEQKYKNNNDLNVVVDVLKDMIQQNNEGLIQYDWLGTTVDIQSSIAKIRDMIDSVKNDEDLHPSDLELLKYMVYLHSTAKEDFEKTISKHLRALLLPKTKNKHGLIKERGLLNRVWLIRTFEEEVIPDCELVQFEEFVEDLETAIYDIHAAIKHIAMITPYDHQNWFNNLKQLHLSSKRKQILEVLLHLSITRLLGVIEETAKNGVEDDFVNYINKHEKEVERTIEEFESILKILDELKSIR